MDPITAAIFAALSAGVASGATDIAKKSIVDGYEELKFLLKKKFGGNSDAVVALEKLQAKPDSEGRRKTLVEELGAVKAAIDPELMRTAQSLLDLVKDLPQAEQHILQVAQGSNIAQATGGGTSTVIGTVSGEPGKKNND